MLCMESKRQYVDKPSRDIGLPREVYYRCIWTVRDMERMSRLVSAASSSDAPGMEDMIIDRDAVMSSAGILKCINESIESVPEVYRLGIMDNIINRKPFGDIAHPNTWKRWKKVFLCELARHLHMI